MIKSTIVLNILRREHEAPVCVGQNSRDCRHDLVAAFLTGAVIHRQDLQGSFKNFHAGALVDEILASIGGEETETVSFVSDKNTNVISVQFVMKTAAIETEEVIANDMQEKDPFTFWQKLLRLFGMY